MQEQTDSQQDILFRLKTRGPQTAKQLAAQLGISSVGTRQHLAGLKEAGLVVEAEEAEHRGGRGRPVRPWRLTEKGHQRFPDTHAGMTVALIASVRDVFGEPGLNALISQRTAATLRDYEKALEGADDTEKRLEGLCARRSEEGYMCELKSLGDDGWLLIENHCPICAAATACQGFCQSELDVFRQVLGAGVSVERINHLLAGARRCAYRITPLESVQA